MDQDSFARLKPAATDQVGPDGKEIFGNRCTGCEIESSGQSQAVTRVDPAIFGVTSARRQSADLIPDFPGSHFSTKGNYLSRRLLNQESAMPPAVEDTSRNVAECPDD